MFQETHLRYIVEIVQITDWPSHIGMSSEYLTQTSVQWSQKEHNYFINLEGLVVSSMGMDAFMGQFLARHIQNFELKWKFYFSN